MREELTVVVEGPGTAGADLQTCSEEADSCTLTHQALGLGAKSHILHDELRQPTCLLTKRLQEQRRRDAPHCYCCCCWPDHFRHCCLHATSSVSLRSWLLHGGSMMLLGGQEERRGSL